MCKTHAGDDWRVVLRGDLQNYIHAVFANVGTLQDNFNNFHLMFLPFRVTSSREHSS